MVFVRLRRFAVWWLVAFATWWAYVGSFSGDELFWGAGLAAITAVTGVLITEAGLVDGRSLGRSLRVTPSVIRAVLVDFVLVMVELLRRVRRGERGTAGMFVRRPVHEHPTLTAPVRAWLTIATTASANAYVIDLDPDRDEVLIHDLIPRRSSERPA